MPLHGDRVLHSWRRLIVITYVNPSAEKCHAPAERRRWSPTMSDLSISSAPGNASVRCLCGLLRTAMQNAKACTHQDWEPGTEAYRRRVVGFASRPSHSRFEMRAGNWHCTSRSRQLIPATPAFCPYPSFDDNRQAPLPHIKRPRQARPQPRLLFNQQRLDRPRPSLAATESAAAVVKCRESGRPCATRAAMTTR